MQQATPAKSRTRSRLPELRSADAREMLAADLSALLKQLGVAVVLRYGASKGSAESPTFTVAGYTFVVEAKPWSAPKLDLTPRQATIVGLIGDGLTNREIAERLGISLHTVRRHVEALLRRLNVPSRVAAARLLAGESRAARS